MDSAVFAVFSRAASSADEVRALAVACAALTGALVAAAAGAGATGSLAAAGSGGLKKTGKGDPPIGDPFTSTLS